MSHNSSMPLGNRRSRQEVPAEQNPGEEAGGSPRKKRAMGAAKDKNCECTTCGKAISQSSDLTRHMHTHAGERPFECSTCGEAFSDSGNLAGHCRRIHADFLPRL